MKPPYHGPRAPGYRHGFLGLARPPAVWIGYDLVVEFVGRRRRNCEDRSGAYPISLSVGRGTVPTSFVPHVRIAIRGSHKDTLSVLDAGQS